MLNWTHTQTRNGTLFSASILDTEENNIRKTIEATADKAISLLKTNIQDDSLYLLFEWNEKLATLNIVVTDSTKSKDSDASTQCRFPTLAEELKQDSTSVYSELVKFWLHDYLTTCSAFFSYSLVAIFHSSTRNNTELL